MCINVALVFTLGLRYITRFIGQEGIKLLIIIIITNVKKYKLICE